MKPTVMWDIDFRDKISAEELNKKINDFIRLNPSVELVLQVPSTQGATSSFVKKLDPRIKIRIAGAYNSERIEQYKYVKFSTGADCKEAFVDSVIYTRNETIRILSEIEKIEEGLVDNWSDMQKALYIYDVLKKTIMYDPKYKEKEWRDIRSLRGLITKKTVCAGYSLMYKEILERNGIPCEFIVGNGHAWNILKIDEQYISADITHDHYNYYQNNTYAYEAFGQSDSQFNKKRQAEIQESFTKYVGNLTELSHKYKSDLVESISLEKKYEKETIRYKRKDGSRFLVAQIGEKIVRKGGFNIIYYRYYYSEINSNGEYQEPKILYSQENLLLKNDKKIIKKLFSKENIKQSEYKNTPFLGNLSLNNISNIVKSDRDIRLIGNPTKTFKREDGSTIIIEEINTPKIINLDKQIYSFYCYQIDEKTGILKSNKIYTEMNLIKTNDKNVANILLSSKRIYEKNRESGGYIGYLDINGKIKNNKNLVKYYMKDKVKENSENKKTNYIMMPEFYELDYLARNYEVMVSEENKKIIVRDIKSKKILEDPKKELKAIFANMWLVSAGITKTQGEPRKGIKDAFSKDKKYIYDFICNQLIYNLRNKRTVNIDELYRSVRGNLQYEKIVLNLFKNEFQVSVINNLFYSIASVNDEKIIFPKLISNIDRLEDKLTR